MNPVNIGPNDDGDVFVDGSKVIAVIPRGPATLVVYEGGSVVINAATSAVRAALGWPA